MSSAPGEPARVVVDGTVTVEQPLEVTAADAVPVRVTRPVSVDDPVSATLTRDARDTIAEAIAKVDDPDPARLDGIALAVMQAGFAILVGGFALVLTVGLDGYERRAIATGSLGAGFFACVAAVSLFWRPPSEATAFRRTKRLATFISLLGLVAAIVAASGVAIFHRYQVDLEHQRGHLKQHS